MQDLPPARSGGQILAQALVNQGVDTAFCVPGESYLPLLDGLYDHRDTIRLITCRHEGGAANMADAYGKLTGRPGLCMVTRGPGACNAAVGVHTAMQDSTPMILLVGQVARGQMEREAFQEVDYRRMFGPLCKWVAEIDSAARIPEFISRAFHTALAGRPGPVVLALPEDMLRERAQVADLGPARVVHPAPAPGLMAELRDRLAAARRPLLILGGGGWTRAAAQDLQAFAEANGLPVAVGFRRQDLFDNTHPGYVGHVGIGVDAGLAEMVRSCDLLIAIGARLGEMTSAGYTLITPPEPRQPLIHVHADAEELGRVYRPVLPIHAGMAEFARAARSLAPVASAHRRDWLAAGRRNYETVSTPLPRADVAGVDMNAVMAHLRQVLPEDALIANGAGNYTVWVHRFLQWRRPLTQLAPTSGAMGYGVSAAVAAKTVHPGRLVVCFAGDGCFLMTGQELATAVQYGLDPVIIVVNNGLYGTIRAHQERHYPGRVIATDLVNPDFAALARACGAHGERVERTADFPAAFARARAAGKAALIEVMADPDAITPATTLGAMRAAAQAAAGQD